MNIFLSGLEALREYIVLHVVTCLIPAFSLAGAMVTFIKREAILANLGEKQNKLKSFSLATLASFLIAACSCTVIPVASGLYYAGAGIGVAFIVLWVAPAANVLALTYTGSILGIEMVSARVIAALSMAFLIGYIMSFAFRNEKRQEFAHHDKSGKIIEKEHLILMILLVFTLLLPNYLVIRGPYLHKIFVFGIMSIISGTYAYYALTFKEIKRWIIETWWFVKLIFPLLLAGVFIVGIISALIPQEWISEWLGGNSLIATFLATLIGAFSYFATMTEAPFVDTLMGMGMGKGPALALLLTGPGISLPNWLAIARIFGIKKALVYVPAIMILGTFVSWFFGNFIL